MSDETSQPVDENSKKTREAAEESKALNTLTDHVEEKELDTAKVSKAMTEINASQIAAREAQRQREKELAAVKVTAEDIQTVMEELEVDKKQADTRLREHQGSVKAALQSFLKV